MIIETLKTFGENIGFADVDPRTIVARLIKVAMGFMGIVMVLMIISGGTLMMISGGDVEKVKRAKKTIINAVIGLIIMLSAYGIVTFVINIFDDKTIKKII